MQGAELTRSPVYLAAAEELGDGRGLSLRFPRFLRVRADKEATAATSSAAIAALYRGQARRMR